MNPTPTPQPQNAPDNRKPQVSGTTRTPGSAHNRNAFFHKRHHQHKPLQTRTLRAPDAPGATSTSQHGAAAPRMVLGKGAHKHPEAVKHIAGARMQIVRPDAARPMRRSTPKPLVRREGDTIPAPAVDTVRIIPLGGVEEIGKNMTAIESLSILDSDSATKVLPVSTLYYRTQSISKKDKTKFVRLLSPTDTWTTSEVFLSLCHVSVIRQSTLAYSPLYSFQSVKRNSLMCRSSISRLLKRMKPSPSVNSASNSLQ